MRCHEIPATNSYSGRKPHVLAHLVCTATEKLRKSYNFTSHKCFIKSL